MYSRETAMATTNLSWVAGEITEDVDAEDAARIAHKLGGIVANDGRIREAIQKVIDNGPNEQAILAAVAKALSTDDEQGS